MKKHIVTMTHVVIAESADLALEAVIRRPTDHLNAVQVKPERKQLLHFSVEAVKDAALIVRSTSRDDE
jgi:hypothetical protein